MKIIKKILLVLLLGPLFPLLSIPDNGNEEKDPNEKDPKDEQDPMAEKDPIPEKTFNQAELDSIVTKRLNRERKAWQKQLDEDKAKQDLTENEKLKLEKEEADKKVLQAIETANKRLIRAEIINKAASKNVIDTDVVLALIDMEDIEVNENGDIKGVDDALKALIEKKPYLIKGKSQDEEDNRKAGDDQQQGQGKKTKVSFNDLIRKATGRI